MSFSHLGAPLCGLALSLAAVWTPPASAQTPPATCSATCLGALLHPSAGRPLSSDARRLLASAGYGAATSTIRQAVQTQVTDSVAANTAIDAIERVTNDVTAIIANSAPDGQGSRQPQWADTALGSMTRAMQTQLRGDAQSLVAVGLAIFERDRGSLQELSARVGEDRLSLLQTALRNAGVLSSTDTIFGKAGDARLTKAAVDLVSAPITSLKRAADAAQANAVGSLVSSFGKVRDNIVQETGGLNKVETQRTVLSEKEEILRDAARNKLADLHSFEADVKLRAAVKDFQGTLSGVSQELRSVAAVVDSFGAPPEVTRALSFADGAISFFSNLTSCALNPASVLPTVLSGGSLFRGFGGGGSGDDAIAQALGQILALQKQILTKLEDLQREIRRNQEEVMNGLQTVNTNVVLVYNTLRLRELQDVAECPSLLPLGSTYGPEDGELRGRLKLGVQSSFPTYEAFRDHAASMPWAVKACLSGMSQYFTAPPVTSGGFIPQQFLLTEAQIDIKSAQPTQKASTVNVQQEMLNEYQRDIVNALLDLVAQYARPEYLCTSARGSTRFSYLIPASPRAVPLSPCSPTSRLTPYSNGFSRDVRTPLNPLTVQVLAGWLAGMHYYYEMADSSGAVISAKQLRARRIRVSDGLRKLQLARYILDVAIAQAALQGGDFLVPVAYASWQESDPFTLVCGRWEGSAALVDRSAMCRQPDTNDAKQQRDLWVADLRTRLLDEPANAQRPGLIRSNPLFAQNVARYLVHRRLRDGIYGPVHYEIAYASRASTELLQRVLWAPSAARLHLEYIDKEYIDKNTKVGNYRNVGWYVQIGNELVPLPTPEEVYSQQLALHPGLIGLLDARDRVTREILGYTELDPRSSSLSTQQRKDLSLMMELGQSPF